MSSRRKLRPPSYLKHRCSDGVLRARTVLRWPGGRKEQKSLGRYGSPESYAEHQRLVAEWRSAWEALGRGEAPAGPVRTVADLVERYWAQMREALAGKGELANLNDALRPLVRVHGEALLRDFGPKSLKALRLSMVRGDWLYPEEREARRGHGRPVGMSRKYLNRHLWRVKRLFAWAESEELVPAGTHHALLTVESLREGELGVREADEVPPVPPAHVEAACQFLGGSAAALVRVQLLTAARPGELVGLRPCDLRRSGKHELAPGLWIDTGACWVFQPAKHKTAYRNHRRVVLFGPRAQSVLLPLLGGRPADAPLFPPPATNVCPGPGPRYLVRSYAQAVRRACKAAGVPAWSPNQLRHLAATEITREFGLDVARIVLGHRKADVTTVYALPDLRKAVEAIGRVG